MKQKYFYKYIILGACFLLMAFPFSIINSIHSLFITPVTKEFGFSNTSFSLLFTISALTVAIASPVVGKLMNLLPLKLTMSIASLLAGFGFIAYGFCTKLYSFYLVAIFVAIGMTGLTTLPVSLMITNWFPEKKGTALGIAFAGIGTGSFFFMQIVSRIISKKGYAFSYLLLGGLILLVTLPISLCIVKKAPPEKEESSSKSSKKDKIMKTKRKGLPLGRTFFYFLAALFLIGMTISGTKVHVQPYLDVTGYNAIHNANVGSTIAFFSLFGNLVAGYLFDRFGIRKAVLIYGSLNFLSTICLMFIGINWISFLFAACFGLALNLPGLLPSYGVTALFPDHEYSTTLGFTNSIFTIGSSIGPTLTGFFADHILGYRGAWLFYSIAVVSYVFILLRMLKNQRNNQTS